jgi:hypothetical protein
VFPDPGQLPVANAANIVAPFLNQAGDLHDRLLVWKSSSGWEEIA